MRKQCKNSAGFSVPELLIVILVIGALFGVGGYVWSSNVKTRQTSTKTTTPPTVMTIDEKPDIRDPFEDWKTYTNNELGFKFKYPQDWGTVSVSRQALNNEKYETNLPYVIKFSNSEAPRALIIPSDWKFTPPGPSEWNSPMTRERLQGEGMVQMVQDQSKMASISYSGFSGEIEIVGLKSVSLSKIGAKQIELHKTDQYESKKNCLTQKQNAYGSTEDIATLDCYSEAYRTDFVKFLDGFTAI